MVTKHIVTIYAYCVYMYMYLWRSIHPTQMTMWTAAHSCTLLHTPAHSCTLRSVCVLPFMLYRYRNMPRPVWLLLIASVAARSARDVACQIAWLPDREPITVPAGDRPICAREQHLYGLQCSPSLSTFINIPMNGQLMQCITRQANATQGHSLLALINSTPIHCSPSE